MSTRKSPWGWEAMALRIRTPLLVWTFSHPFFLDDSSGLSHWPQMRARIRQKAPVAGGDGRKVSWRDTRDDHRTSGGTVSTRARSGPLGQKPLDRGVETGGWGGARHRTPAYCDNDAQARATLWGWGWSRRGWRQVGNDASKGYRFQLYSPVGR